MNELGGVLVGVAIRLAVFAPIGLGLAAIARRRAPAASAAILLATLLGMVAVAGLGVGPAPRWWGVSGWSQVPVATGGAEVPRYVPQGHPAAGDRPATEPADPKAAEAMAAPATGEAGASILDTLGALGRAVVEESSRSGRRGEPWGWRAWAGLIILAAAGLGLARFGAGWLAVEGLRRRGREVNDAVFLRLVDRVAGELGIGREVEVLVIPGLAGPATLGWKRPAILLPEDWTTWDDRERFVVVAHELAHVGRGDYLAGIAASLARATHYYHPMAHWVVRRLRDDQELAADAIGATVSGGSRPYLAALARLALKADPRPIGWPARAFRPGRGAFLRRIEMLRDAHLTSNRPMTRRGRAAALGSLALAGLAVAGFRGPLDPPPASAQVPGQARSTPAANPAPTPGGEIAASPNNIPADTAIVAAIRPADLLRSPKLAALLDAMIPKQGRPPWPIQPEEIEQITFLWSFDEVFGPRRGPVVGQPAGAIVRGKGAVDWKETIAKVIPEVTSSQFGGLTILGNPNPGPDGYVATILDDGTLLVGQRGFLLRMARSKGEAGVPWSAAWKGIRRGQVAIAADATFLAGRLAEPPGPSPVASPVKMFAPLLTSASAYAIGLDVSPSGSIALDGLVTCPTEADAERVADTLKAVVVLGRNAFGQFWVQGAAGGNRSNSGAVAEATLIRELMPVLEGIKITKEGTTTRLKAAGDTKIIDAVLSPAVVSARANARRAQSVNSMKQIGLAMHNFNSANDHFPAATVIGPDGKTPHSWRVAILPFIEKQDVYNKYKFDEPWDSPSNLKLIPEMPAIYGIPGGGSKPGAIYGETDDFCYNIVKDPVHIRDFHATILHLLGFDHNRFTYKYQGLDQKLTGVEPAHVIKALLA